MKLTVKDYIIKCIDERSAAGLKKYGKTIDDGAPPTGDWYLEVIQETIDGLQYAIRKCLDLEEEIRSLKEEIRRYRISYEVEKDYIG